MALSSWPCIHWPCPHGLVSTGLVLTGLVSLAWSHWSVWLVGLVGRLVGRVCQNMPVYLFSKRSLVNSLRTPARGDTAALRTSAVVGTGTWWVGWGVPGTGYWVVVPVPDSSRRPTLPGLTGHLPCQNWSFPGPGLVMAWSWYWSRPAGCLQGPCDEIGIECQKVSKSSFSCQKQWFCVKNSDFLSKQWFRVNSFKSQRSSKVFVGIKTWFQDTWLWKQ